VQQGRRSGFLRREGASTSNEVDPSGVVDARMTQLLASTAQGRRGVRWRDHRARRSRARRRADHERHAEALDDARDLDQEIGAPDLRLRRAPLDVVAERYARSAFDS
jgi:hypothetical protein